MSDGGDGRSGDEAGEPQRPAFAAVIDPRLIDACERHTRAGQRLVREPSLRTQARAPRLHLDPAAWRAGYLQVREREDLPAQLFNDLHQLMPQALLRDLHRLEYEVGWVERPLIEGSAIDRGGFEGLTEARAARTRAPLPRIEGSTGAVRAHQRWRRELLASTWEPALRDDEPRRLVTL